MADLQTHQSGRTFRGTWGEILSHQKEIAETAEVQLIVFEAAGESAAAAMEFEPMSDAKRAAALALLDSWITEGMAAHDETRRLADEEVAEFKRNINANRAEAGESPAFP